MLVNSLHMFCCIVILSTRTIYVKLIQSMDMAETPFKANNYLKIHHSVTEASLKNGE